jgi:hypothetical protein
MKMKGLAFGENSVRDKTCSALTSYAKPYAKLIFNCLAERRLDAVNVLKSVVHGLYYGSVPEPIDQPWRWNGSFS